MGYTKSLKYLNWLAKIGVEIHIMSGVKHLFEIDHEKDKGT